MAQQIARSTIAFGEQRLCRKPISATVVLGGYSMVIAMHGVLTSAEQTLVTSSTGTTQVREFQKQLHQLFVNPLRQEIWRITGLELRQVAKAETTAAVKVFSVGTVVLTFLLAGRLPSETWSGT